MAERKFLVELTTDIVAAHISNNTVSLSDVPTLIQRVHQALISTGSPAAEVTEQRSPAVSMRASLKPDYLVCMECGRKQKTLRRHLRTAHGLSPEQYRKAYRLPASYPMAAPNYSERRREMAKSIGLGRRKDGTAARAAGNPRKKK
jgi:predicted transcriptional regulator